MKRLLLIAVVLIFPAVLSAEEGKKADDSAVKWLAVDRALKDGKEEKKPVLIYFYAEWCGYCKKMMQGTYGDKAVIKKINSLFKATSIDIEGKKEFLIDGKKITEADFADGFNVTSTPTTWFVKPDGELIKGIPGYIESEEFLEILRYVGEGWYEKMNIIEYLNKRPEK